MAKKSFDVFLCHNSEDKPAVIEIAQQIEQHGLKPWLDEWELPPGVPWQDPLENQIRQIKSAAVFIGKNGLGPWQDLEIKAFLREFVKRKCPVIPVLLPDAPIQPELPIFLGGMMWVDFRQVDPSPMDQLIWGITGKKPKLRHDIQLGVSKVKTISSTPPLVEDILLTEKAQNNEQLHQSLLKLGYVEQVQIFRQFIETQSIAAFLIHGEPGYGQRWLLNRLILRNLKGSINAQKVQIQLGRHGRRNGSPVLWREMAEQVKLERNDISITKIVERVYNWWQSQHVLIIISDVDFLTETAFNELICEFWQPLATQTEGSFSRNKKFRLLMFLIDNGGSVGTWKFSCVEKLNPRWQPSLPIKLPLISLFSDEELISWLKHEVDELPTQLTEKVEETAQIIINDSENGVPEPAIQRICVLANCDWYEHEKQWLKYG